MEEEHDRQSDDESATQRVEIGVLMLEQAIAVARAGDLRGGRELCASVLSDIQPMLARCEALFRTVVLALLLSQGFKLLIRVVVALTGQRIRVMLQQDENAVALPPRCREYGKGTILTVDPRWLAELTVDDAFLLSWCEALADGRASVSDHGVHQRVLSSLEPKHSVEF